jgi:DNA polymerase
VAGRARSPGLSRPAPRADRPRERAREPAPSKPARFERRADDVVAALEEVRRAALACRRCDLWKHGTRTVFGEGPPDARWMLVGEIPGDREDREGRPFVGPAGRLLDEALAEVGLDRATGWLTNVVKHFKYKQSGKRRIHDRPRNVEIVACVPWLEQELALVRPDVVVCLGATAAKAVIGKDFSVQEQRGELVELPIAPYVFATVHPSSLLRARQFAPERWRDEKDRFVADLRRIRELLDR